MKNYKLNLKDIDPDLAKKVKENQELNRLMETATKFFECAINTDDKEMVDHNIKWAMEQVNMAHLLVVGKYEYLQKNKINI